MGAERDDGDEAANDDPYRHNLLHSLEKFEKLLVLSSHPKFKYR